ncbi:MAG: hypothetical protein AAF367_00470 [Pseudomonadota bacterium]
MSGANVTSPAMSGTASIISVSYDTRAMMRAWLRALKAETSQPHRLIAVDAASSDGLVDTIAVTEVYNHGFPKADNIAAKAATGRYTPRLPCQVAQSLTKTCRMARRISGAGLGRGDGNT